MLVDYLFYFQSNVQRVGKRSPQVWTMSAAALPALLPLLPLLKEQVVRAPVVKVWGLPVMRPVSVSIAIACLQTTALERIILAPCVLQGVEVRLRNGKRASKSKWRSKMRRGLPFAPQLTAPCLGVHGTRQR